MTVVIQSQFPPSGHISSCPWATSSTSSRCCRKLTLPACVKIFSLNWDCKFNIDFRNKAQLSGISHDLRQQSKCPNCQKLGFHCWLFFFQAEASFIKVKGNLDYSKYNVLSEDDNWGTRLLRKIMWQIQKSTAEWTVVTFILNCTQVNLSF